MKFSTRLKYSPIYVLSLIPTPLLYALSDLVSTLLYKVMGYRIDTVRSNLNRSFPEKSEQEIRKIEKAFYQHFCDVFIESMKSMSLSKKQVNQRFKIKNPELIEQYKDRSIILYTAHQGNWEWFSFLPLFLSNHQVTTFYQPLSNSYFDGLMKLIRSRFGVICVESNKGYKSILQFARKNIPTLNIIIGDQSPRNDSTKHWTNFLNQETAFLIGSDKIAKKSNQVVLFPAYRKVKRGHYELEFKLLEESPKEHKNYHLIDQYAASLEKAISDSPALWLWSHRRWKLRKEAV